jgi:FkbM family methyltransferase
MSATQLLASGLRRGLALLPAGYAAKAARKIKTELARYGEHTQSFSSRFGAIELGGLGWRGANPDIAMFEPETIGWIDTHVKQGDVLWDIGASLGIYAIYAAKAGARSVYAFEPFAATYLQLQRNLVANRVDDRVMALNLAVAARTEIGRLALTSFEAGVTSTIEGHELTHLRRSAPIGHQHVLSIAAADFVRWLPQSAPDHLKLDVDGAEALVLDGLMPIAARLTSLMVEIEPSFRADFDGVFAPRLVSAGLTERAIDGPSSGRNRLFVRADAA